MEKKLKLSPSRILLSSYLFVITIGTILLALPQSRFVPIPFIDLLFTSASCTCITGQTTVPVSYFTPFGKTVLLCLIQLGGLGLMTLSLFFISLFLNIGMATQVLAGEMFEFRWSRIKTFIITIVSTAFIFELFGAIYFFFSYKKLLPTKTAIFHSIFHSVSAFCNTGLSLFEDGILPFQNNFLFLFITAFLVFAGSIGFVVWFEIANKIKSYFEQRNKKTLGSTKERTFKPFSLHTKIVLFTTTAIILFGTTTIWLLERNHAFQNMTFFKGIFTSFFYTVSLRSAGFELLPINQFVPATILIFFILMYIGGSAGSIAGGIKTTTFALFISTMATIVRNRDEVEIFGRKIAKDQIYRAISIIVLTATWIISTTFLLLVIEPQISPLLAELTFIQALFEVISSLCLCGLKTKIAASFSIFGKLIIILTMFVGRVGTLTLILALWKRKKKSLYRYPEENIIVG